MIDFVKDIVKLAKEYRAAEHAALFYNVATKIIVDNKKSYDF